MFVGQTKRSEGQEKDEDDTLPLGENLCEQEDGNSREDGLERKEEDDG